MPSGRRAEPLITDNLDRTVTVQFSPSEAGLHEMHIKYNGTHIPGTHTRTLSLRLSLYINTASMTYYISEHVCKLCIMYVN